MIKANVAKPAMNEGLKSTNLPATMPASNKRNIFEIFVLYDIIYKSIPTISNTDNQESSEK